MLFIQRYFGTLLILTCMAGMIIPSIGDLTSIVVIFALAFIIFCSFFQLALSRSVIFKETKLSLQFWILRYIVMPVIAFFIMRPFSQFYAQVLLLTFVLPAAVSSPAFCAIYGGKPDLSLKLLIYSSFLSVASIPVLMGILDSSSVHLDAGRMLLTLIYTIVVPFLLHLPLRNTTLKKHILHYNPLLTLIGLSVIFIFVTARNKQIILDNLNQVAIYALISIIIYVAMYVAGYFMISGQNKTVRRTFSISSGANNIGLGVTLTALFFPGPMNIFFIISQLIWVVMLVPLRRIFKQETSDNTHQ